MDIKLECIDIICRSRFRKVEKFIMNTDYNRQFQMMIVKPLEKINKSKNVKFFMMKSIRKEKFETYIYLIDTHAKNLGPNFVNNNEFCSNNHIDFSLNIHI